MSEHGPGTREHVTALLEQSARAEDAQVALSSGRITWWHALAIAEAAQPLDDVTAQRLEADVVAIATRSTLANTRRAIQRALARHDAAGAADRHEAGKAVSDVVSWPERDGLAVLQVRGTAAEIARLQGVVDAAAADGAGDGRSLGRRRVEALVRLLCDGSGSAKPRRAGLQVQLVVDLPTVVGLADHPAVIPGYGPIPAPIAREWAADAVSWRRLVVDPVSGSLLDYGQTRYRPPPGLAQFVRARDRFCRFPGCRRPAERCDLDHSVAFADGGTTSSQSLQALCRTHHRLKTFTDWVSRRRPDGAVEWSSPTGRRTVVDPHHHLHD